MSQHSEFVIDEHYADLNPVQFGYQNCEPSHFYGPAVRTHWLLHYVVAGEGRFTREGKTYSLGAGDVFVIPPYLETYYEADERRPWEYIWIGFTTARELPRQLGEPVIRCPGAGTLFQSMKECARLETGRSAFLSAKLWELMSFFLEQGKGRVDDVRKAIHCIRNEYMQPLTVQALADRLGLDRSYFSAIFKEQTGLPPGRYLLRYRMERAAELMREQGESPATAGASVGYPDVCHFSKVFKSHFGQSPRNYLKNNR